MKLSIYPRQLTFHPQHYFGIDNGSKVDIHSCGN